jgi:prevent-host-death family protein
MKEVALFEAKTRLSELLDAVEQGEQVVITRRGQPVATLVAATGRRAASRRQHVASVLQRLAARRRGVTLEGDIREIAAEGRD